MRTRLIQLILTLAFAVAVGDFAFRTWKPALTPDYMVEAVAEPLSLAGERTPGKHLYLRRTWSLTRAPEQAWIQLLGHDVLELYVNGRMAGRTERTAQKRISALVTDISPYLHVGENSIAIHAAQIALDRPPAVAIDGQMEFADDSQERLDNPNDWRASEVYDRRGAFWYETAFDDAHWAAPRIGEPVAWRGQVALPPRAVTVPHRSFWILPGESDDGAAVFARSFTLSGKPREGWLRVLATGPYRLAVNGWIVADDHFELALAEPAEALERTFDISALLKRGSNTVSLAISTRGEAPRLRADLEATTNRKERIYLATDNSWQSQAGHVHDWHLLDPAVTSGWRACEAEVGYLQFVPRRVLRELAELRPPLGFWLLHLAARFGIVLLFAAVAWGGCRAVAKLPGLVNDNPRNAALNLLPWVALVPSTLAAVVGRFMTWDFLWSGLDIYQPFWLGSLVLLVVAQWLLLAVIASTTSTSDRARLEIQTSHVSWQRYGWAACWLLVIGLALWLRVRNITAEPIHHDEISAYAFTQGVLKYGFPGGQVHPDLPFGWCSTSELAYYAPALCEFFVDDPRLVLRIPAVVWSMATLLLVGYVGARWFNPSVGLVAAFLYGMSPHVIGWANLGRYLSQVQFFTALTMFFTYEAFRGTVVRRGMVWAAAISMAATYLSWEGAGMFGIGLALAVLILRRHDLRPVIACPSIYTSGMCVILVVAAQNAHRILQQTQRMWYGEGISDMALVPMWRFPFFDLDYFLMSASWTRDALLPMIAFGIACFMAVRHRWRVPLRFTIICLASNALLMAAFLPLRTNRYSYHLLPILVLIAAVVMVAFVEPIWRIGHEVRLYPALRRYASTVAVGMLMVLVGLASGWTVRTRELSDFVVAAFDVGQMRYPHWDGPTQYLREHLREGDVVIATFPHTQNFLMATGEEELGPSSKVDYWLESTLVIQATLGDERNVPLDRRSGTAMVYDLDQLKELFTEHDRVWYCTTRFGQSRINDQNVSQFLREHMDVVYEDFATAVLLHDNNHRPAPLLVEEEEAGRKASDFYLR